MIRKSDDGPLASPPISAANFLPATRSLRALRTAARTCQGCALYQRATQTVFGDGPAHAELMLVGESPGDQEDLQGKPFVGPAGRLLENALQAAGLSRPQVYVTNAVKHFKWEPRGKRRLHGKPSSREMAACEPWLEAEIEAVQPLVVLCLGATAARVLLGPKFRLTRQHGELVSSNYNVPAVATYHPSAVLRAPDSESRRRMRQQLFADLRVAAEAAYASKS
jgi:DNA polymerase